jgi:polyisoprenoid-binding protein YceI
VTRYRIVPDVSTVFIDARSTLHAINTRTDGLVGFLEVTLADEGTIDLNVPPKGRLSLAVEQLSSGNPLEDRELRRRIDARRFPTIEGDLVAVQPTERKGHYLVRGDLTFKGVTNGYESDMTIAAVDARTLSLAGEATCDIRDFGMAPPRILMLKVEPLVKVRVEIVAEPETLP